MKINKVKNGILVVAGFVMLSTLTQSCSKEQGCTDSSASNYDADAEEDDNSCLYVSDTTGNSTNTGNTNNNNNNNGNTTVTNEYTFDGTKSEPTYSQKSTNDPVNVTHVFGTTSPFQSIQFITAGEPTSGSRPTVDYLDFGNDLMTANQIYVLVVSDGVTYLGQAGGTVDITVSSTEVNFVATNVTVLSQADYTTTKTFSSDVVYEK